MTNIPPSIEAKLGRRQNSGPLHLVENHPVEIVKSMIYRYFSRPGTDYKFVFYDNLSPVVSVEDNFDKLLIPKDHPARSKSDTYYVNDKQVLRTHTSAHQNEILARGVRDFLVTGDVYRKDEIDRHHYPVFHQTEGVAHVPKGKDPEEELLRVLGGLVKYLFPGVDYRVNSDYFPFTHPSFEIEVKWINRSLKESWLEILGCGVVQPAIVRSAFVEPNECESFWAFGIGLERLALILFDIPDIRYLWSTDPKFTCQFAGFAAGEKFKPYSKLPNQTNDISFWIPEGKITGDKWEDDNDFYELVREIGGDWVEEVKLMDKFYHGKKNMHSRMYRIIYSPSDPSMKDPAEFTEKINSIQEEVRNGVSGMDVVLR